MYGTTITIGNHKIFVLCVPTTSIEDIRERAIKKLNKFIKGEIHSLL